MPGKRLTKEDKFKFFQRMVELEENPEMRRRYIKQWHLGQIKIYKRRGKIVMESHPERVLLPMWGGKLETSSYEEV